MSISKQQILRAMRQYEAWHTRCKDDDSFREDAQFYRFYTEDLEEIEQAADLALMRLDCTSYRRAGKLMMAWDLDREARQKQAEQRTKRLHPRGEQADQVMTRAEADRLIAAAFRAGVEWAGIDMERGRPMLGCDPSNRRAQRMFLRVCAAAKQDWPTVEAALWDYLMEHAPDHNAVLRMREVLGARESLH